MGDPDCAPGSFPELAVAGTWEVNQKTSGRHSCHFNQQQQCTFEKKKQNSLFADRLIVYIENTVESNKSFSTTNEFRKVKINTKESNAFLYVHYEQAETKTKHWTPLIFVSKKMKSLGTNISKA